MLETLLTEDTLRRYAGPSFVKGDVYHRAGNVESFTVEDNILRGIVVGSERYLVHIAVRGQHLSMVCTCPVGDRCKHAVALALAYLDRAPKTRGAPTGLLDTRDEVTAWAAAHGVTHALAISAGVIVPAIARTINPYVLHGLSLRDAAAWSTIRRYIPYAAEAVAKAALGYLEDEAASRRGSRRRHRARHRSTGIGHGCGTGSPASAWRSGPSRHRGRGRGARCRSGRSIRANGASCGARSRGSRTCARRTRS